MNTVTLKALVDAVEAMKMLRDVADPHLKPEQYMQALYAWAEIKAQVQYITEQTKVECV